MRGCVCVAVCQTLLDLYLASVVVHKVVLAFVANVDVVAIPCHGEGDIRECQLLLLNVGHVDAHGELEEEDGAVDTDAEAVGGCALLIPAEHDHAAHGGNVVLLNALQ